MCVVTMTVHSVFRCNNKRDSGKSTETRREKWFILNLIYAVDAVLLGCSKRDLVRSVESESRCLKVNMRQVRQCLRRGKGSRCGFGECEIV